MKQAFVLIMAIMLTCMAAFAQQPCNNQALSKANNQFAIDVYKELLKKKEPVFFSPYSIYSALSMTAEGAKNNTATEMQHTLHSTGIQECLQKDIRLGQLQFNQLLALGDSIRNVNSLWVQKEISILPSFYKTVKGNYSAEVNETDFIRAAETSRKKINSWVEDQTNNRIKDLLAPGMISSATRMVLVNAIWFKGKWKYPFTHEATQNDDFFAAKDTVIVPFMHKELSIKYAEDETAQVIELPYQSNKLSMIILLPVKGKEVEFEKKFNYGQVDNWLKNMSPQLVNVSLPKFKMQTGFEVADILKQLGMKQAFSNTADFSGISEKEKLKISNVIHKAFIEVDEDGTEAAAATAVIMVGSSAMRPIKIVKTFKADHPFTFLLCDSENKTILFMGKVEKP